MKINRRHRIAQIKSAHHQFKYKQKEPFQYTALNDEEHHCLNCGAVYTGNFCPRCGQSAKTARIKWKSIAAGFLAIFDIEEKSFFSTLWQLLWRPGQLVSDYLDGKRVVYFRPFKMIIMLAIVLALFDHFDGVGSLWEKTLADDSSTFFHWFQQWSQSHAGWAFMIQVFFLLMPTWMLFRFAPRHKRHNIPEGAYIQAYLCIIMVQVSVLSLLFGDWAVLFALLYYYLVYQGVFGYKVWGTLWRLAVAITVAGTTIILLCMCVDLYRHNPVPQEDIYRTIINFTAAHALMIGGWFISRRTERKPSVKRKVVMRDYKQLYADGEKAETILMLKAKEMIKSYYGIVKRENRQDQPETIGDYTLDLVGQIYDDYCDFLVGWWKTMRPKDTYTYTPSQDYRQQLAETEDWDKLVTAYQNAVKRTLWERISLSNYKDVAQYKLMLRRYSRRLLIMLQEDFLEQMSKKTRKRRKPDSDRQRKKKTSN